MPIVISGNRVPATLETPNRSLDTRSLSDVGKALQSTVGSLSGDTQTSKVKNDHYRKPVVGLAGGIGSGKSTVSRLMESLGGGIISSDRLGHEELLAQDVKSTLQRWWGDVVLQQDGAIDRKKVASLVFADPAQRHRLEALLHPRIAVRRRDRMAELAEKPRIRFIVIDSPLLYESDLDLTCDVVVFVDADIEIRRERSEKHRGWPPGELERREKSQHPLDMKRARADYVCQNNSSLSDLQQQVERIVNNILSEFNSV
ncbi:MAG: dephospho-CoA kinase [Phycisphaerales bacterium]|nr:dephospho-CoA kinase [Phycisphaerales bacterium]